MGKLIMLWVILLNISTFCSVDGITHLDSECVKAGNKTTNTTTVYQSNLRSLLNSLLVNAPLQSGFFNTSFGNGSDRVYGLRWCRADASPNRCTECLRDFINIPLKECPESKELVIWSGLCTLRFSNKTFFGELWNASSSSTYGDKGLDDPAVFTRGFSMMEMLGRNVSNQPLMFETAVIDAGKKEKRYGMGQCSRDLSKLDCENCLEKLLMTYKEFVLNQTGWEMLGVSCGMWYDDFPFYDNNSGLNPTPNTSGGKGRWYNKGDMILAFVAILLLY